MEVDKSVTVKGMLKVEGQMEVDGLVEVDGLLKVKELLEVEESKDHWNLKNPLQMSISCILFQYVSNVVVFFRC